MFYGRLSREEGRWITICPSPSSLINSHTARPEYKLEDSRRLTDEESSGPVSEPEIKQNN